MKNIYKKEIISLTMFSQTMYKSKINMLVITQDKHYTELKYFFESLLTTSLLLSF